jgi:hypothetical protein
LSTGFVTAYIYLSILNDGKADFKTFVLKRFAGCISQYFEGLAILRGIMEVMGSNLDPHAGYPD